MYNRILVAIDLNEQSSWRKPLVAAAEQARKFGSEQLIVLTVIREIDALVYAQVGAVGYEMMARGLEPTGRAGPRGGGLRPEAEDCRRAR